MKYSKIAHVETISEWRDADIRYEYLRVFIVTIQRILDGIVEYEETVQTVQSDVQGNAGDMVAQKNQLVASGGEQVNKLKILSREINQLFLSELRTQVQISQMLCGLKLDQVSNHFEMCNKYYAASNQKEKKEILLRFIQYTYIEAVYLSNQLEESEDQERRAVKKHKKAVENQLQTVEPVMSNFIKIPSKKVTDIINSLQKLYIQLRLEIGGDNKFTQRLARTLRRDKKKTIKQELRGYPVEAKLPPSNTFIFGLLVGLFIAVIIFMSILLNSRGMSVEKDPIFNRDFPAWRGMAFTILFIWVLGFNWYYYEKYRISPHVLLDYNDHHRITSTKIFSIAAVFSMIFSLLFCLYALSISGTLNFYDFPPQYLALILWLSFIIFMINPLPTKYHKTRMYFFKTIGQIFFSPLFPIAPAVVWFSDQMLSLVTSVEDFAYTFCYFIRFDFKQTDSYNPCIKPVSIAVFAYVIWLLSIKTLHGLRDAYDKGKFFGTIQFWGFILNLFAIASTVLSYVWTSGQFDSIFIAWMVFTAIVTIWVSIWDIYLDFGLIQKNAQNWMLRNKIMYSPYVYYMIIVLDLALRFVWILTLSPNLPQSGFGSVELFKLVTGGLQIFRRGIWNLISVQYAHIGLCNQLRAMPKNFYGLQGEINSKLQNNFLPTSNNSIKLTLNDTEKGALGNLISNEQLIRSSSSLDEKLTTKKLQNKINDYETERSSTRILLMEKNEEADQYLLSLRAIIDAYEMNGQKP